MTGVAVPQYRRFARTWRLLLWAALTAAIVIAARRLPWADAMEELRRARLSYTVLAVALNFAILPLWATEWRLLVPRAFTVPFRRMFEIVAVTASVLNSVPFLAGEISAVALLSTRGRLSRGAALSVLALDQLLVAFAKLTVLGAAALLVTLPVWLTRGVSSLAIAFMLLGLTLWIVARRRPESVPSGGRIVRVVTAIRGWGQHLETLRDASLALRVALLAIAKKGLELGAIIVVQLALGVEPSLSAGILVLAGLAITTLLPVAPANLGVYEGTVFAIYRYLGHPADVALGLALVQHVCFLVPSIATGYLLVTGRQLRQTPFPAPEPSRRRRDAAR